MRRRLLTAVLHLVFVTPALAQTPGAPPVQPAQPPIEIADTARSFAPGVISRDMSEFGAAFTNSGRTIYYTSTDFGFSRMVILRSDLVAGKWSEPRVASFSGVWNDGDVAASPDGKRLIYISNRPLPGTTTPKADLDIWYVDLQSDGSWGEPRHAGTEVNTSVNETYPHLTRGGDLYFGRGGALFRARNQNAGGGYTAVDSLLFKGFSAPAVAPDESFMVMVGLASANNADLFVSFRQGESWSEPRPLGRGVNTAGAELAPVVSPDMKTLFFARQVRDPIPWPRTAPVRTYEEVRAEASRINNGLRNIYSVDISDLRDGRKGVKP